MTDCDTILDCILSTNNICKTYHILKDYVHLYSEKLLKSVPLIFIISFIINIFITNSESTLSKYSQNNKFDYNKNQNSLYLKKIQKSNNSIHVNLPAGASFSRF